MSLVAVPFPNRGSAIAGGYVSDAGTYAPPASGAYAYYPSYGAFGPDQGSFPRAGESFVDPVFGNSVRRLTNELGQHSFSEIYSKNGFFNADGTLVHHRTPSGHNIISTRTGQVVRAAVTFNSNSSFAPDDPDAWYCWAYGDTTLYKYSVATGNRSVVKTFPGALGKLGGSTDWIDRTGRYMVLNIDGATRVYDKHSDTLYAGSIPGTYGGSGGWSSISPDARYVITSTPPRSSHSWKIDHATQSVSTTPVLFWSLCGGHGDVVSASNGKTYFVSFDCNSTASVYAVDVSLPQSPTNVPQQLGQNRKLFQAAWADSGHFSRVSRGALQDWVFVSVESGDDDFSATTATWRPFKQEIVMANVLSGEVRRLAHHRSRGLKGGTYYYQPRVSTTWDGSVVLWTSNFGHSGDGYADLYAVDVLGSGGGTAAPTPTPTPTPISASVSSPLTLSFVNPGSGASVSGTANVLLSAGQGSGTGYSYTVTAGTNPRLYTGTNNGFSWNTTSSPNGSVTLTATVTDSAGATATSTRTVTVANGTAAGIGTPTGSPTVSITTPTSGVWTGAGINVGAQASSTAKLTTIELWGGGKVFASVPCSSTTCTTGSIRWNTALPNGAYLVNAVAYDEAGGRTTSAAITIYKGAKTPTYASGAPTTSTPTTTPTSGTTSTGTTNTGTTSTGTVAASVAGTAASAGTSDSVGPTAAITSPTNGTWTGNSLKVSMRATDNVGVTSMRLYANGAPANTLNTLTCSSATCEGTVTWLSGALPKGKHTLTAVARDAAGHTTTSAPVTINK